MAQVTSVCSKNTEEMHRGAITRRLYMRGYTMTQIILWQFARILFSYKPGEKCLKLPEFLHEFLSHLEVVLQMHLPPLLQTRNRDINTNRITIYRHKHEHHTVTFSQTSKSHSPWRSGSRSLPHMYAIRVGEWFLRCILQNPQTIFFSSLKMKPLTIWATKDQKFRTMRR